VIYTQSVALILRWHATNVRKRR